MSRIITISREFGSGGRELGKRLAEALHIPCYDHEIIEMIAKENGFNEDYVAHMSEKSIEAAYPLTIGHRFGVPPFQGRWNCGERRGCAAAARYLPRRSDR